MKIENIIKKIDNTKIKHGFLNSLIISLDHVKTLTPCPLNSFKIFKENDNTLTCFKNCTIEGITFKNFETLKSLKNYILKEVKRYQNCSYVSLNSIPRYLTLQFTLK